MRREGILCLAGKLRPILGEAQRKKTSSALKIGPPAGCTNNEEVKELVF
ncbi:hypothetical protein M1N85_01565 [Dehalococcoidia bacterium]|nr:hypothetical protein [Dehalococcoidia bacterium]